MQNFKKLNAEVVKLFFHSVQDPVSILEERVFVECNASTFDMFNIKSGEGLIGKTPWHISPEYQPDGMLSEEKAAKMIEKCIEEGSNRFEWLHLRPDGSHFYGDIHLIRIPETEKETILVLWRDITEAVETQKAYKETEQIYKSVLDNAPTAILIHSDMRWVYANKAVGEIFKVDTEKIMGADIFKYVAPDQKEMITENAKKRAAGEKVPDRYDMRVITESGEEKHLDVKVSPVVFNNKRSVLINCVDITERVAAQKQLEDSEEQLRITLNSIGDAVIATDREGNIVMMNPLAEKLTGWHLEEAKGEKLDTVFMIVNAVSRKKVENPVKKVLEKGETVGLANHTVLCSKDGAEYHIADSGAPINDNEGNIRGVVLVFRDITEKYLLEEQIRQTQKMDAIGQMASGIAHDFNNMLSGLIGNAEILSELVDSGAEEYEYVEKIMDISTKAVNLTRRLLNFSRRNEDLSTEIDIHDLILETVNLLKSSLGSKIEIKDLFYSGSSTVKGDAAQLQNTLINILFNARDAMPEGGVIKISTSKLDLRNSAVNPMFLSPGEYLCVAVEDSGTGIKDDILDKIFEPFFSTKEKGAGTGLGLVSARKTAKDHGGSIAVESEVGKGSVFKIYLPISN